MNYHFLSPTHWIAFTRRLKLLGTNSAAVRSSKVISHEALQHLTSDTRIVLTREMKTSSRQKFHAAMAFGVLSSASSSDLWLPLDIVLEDSMDGYQVNVTSAIEIITGKSRICFLTRSKFFLFDLLSNVRSINKSKVDFMQSCAGLVKTLQAINGTTWHDTFLNLWISALRLVQRVSICYL